MKTKKLLVVSLLMLTFTALPLLPIVTGCNTTQQKQTVNTLFTIGKSVNVTYAGYMDLVVEGKVSTNSVPKVAKAYNTFQGAFNAAVSMVAGNTNAVPPQSVYDAQAALLQAIAQAKKGEL